VNWDMIGAPVTIFDLLLPALIVWAAVKAIRYAKPLWLVSAMRTHRWTIADWFDATFWIAFALAIFRAVATLSSSP
jgi:hypothetical protein